MEDQERGMASTQPKAPSIKDKAHHSRYLTVTIMRSIGRIRTFKIARRTIFFASVFFFIYIIVSLFIINDYFDLRNVNNTQSERIRQLENELSKIGKILLRSKQHLALLEDYIRNAETGREQEMKFASNGNLKEKGMIRRVKKESKGGLEERSERLVDVTDVVIQREGYLLTIDFKLVNVQRGKNPVGGYVHIIAKSDKTNSPQEWTYPRESLSDGIPVNYRRGQLFLIQRFMPFKGRFNLVPNSGTPTGIKVLVYDQSGEVIFEKEFEVSNVF
jgi:hypothetical protein